MKSKKPKAPSLLSRRFLYSAQQIIWIDIEERKKDNAPAMTTVLIDDRLISFQRGVRCLTAVFEMIR